MVWVNKMVYAEDVNYWKTSQSQPDTWMDRAKNEIVAVRGIIVRSGFLSDDETAKGVFMLGFRFGDERFESVWDVLPSKTKNEKAARVQAATLLYHDIKNRCVLVKIKGARFAFLPYWVLPTGKTLADTPISELFSQPQLVSGEIVD